MYCISETSPPTPIIVAELKERRRLTSVKRAREPYDATGKGVSHTALRYYGGRIDSTKVICGDDNAIFEFHGED